MAEKIPKNFTEPAFSGKYWDEKSKGMYRCSNCGVELFSSDAKFDSGTGWPSFWDSASSGAVELQPDDSYGMKRTEAVCKTRLPDGQECGSHLGHVFDDGPKPTGKRYCINSVCLDLDKKEK